MAHAAATERLYACITHVPLPLEFPPFVTPIYLGQAQRPGRMNLRDLAPEWEAFHPLLGGAVGTFACRNLVLRTPGVRSVGLCQYRKFVSRRRLSDAVARSYQTMDMVQKADLPPQRFAQAMDPGPEPFLVSRLFPLRHKRYLGQYAEVHRAQDLLHFTAEAVALGVLAGAEAQAFLGENELIPGGLELGVFPVDFWLPAIGNVEAVVRACIERHPVAGGYQARAWAFCAERLGSYLLLRHFRGGRGNGLERWRRLLPAHWSRRYVGRLNMIAQADEADYAPGAT